MASLKVFFLAVIACSALVNTKAASLQRNIVDDFEKFLEFEKVIEDTANKYLHLFEEVADNVNNQLTQALQEIQNALEAFEKFQQNIEHYSDEFQKCASLQYPKIQQLVEETQVAQAACVKDTTEAVQSIKDRLNKNLEAVREEVAVVIAEIQACEKLECMQEGGKKLFEKVQVVKGYVKEAIAEIFKVGQETSPEAISCVVAASDKFQAEMGKVFTEVQQCVVKA